VTITRLGLAAYGAVNVAAAVVWLDIGRRK
jgi:hypothetical protein